MTLMVSPTTKPRRAAPVSVEFSGEAAGRGTKIHAATQTTGRIHEMAAVMRHGGNEADPLAAVLRANHFIRQDHLPRRIMYWPISGRHGDNAFSFYRAA